MTKNYFIPRNEHDKALWLKNFARKIDLYASKYNISKADVEDMHKSSVYLSYWLDYLNNYNQPLRKLAEDRIFSNVQTFQTPPFANTETPPDVVKPGIFKRAFLLGLFIKSSRNYNIADGNDLGIEDSDD